MRFRTIVIAAVILVLAASGALAAFQMADYARGEAAQETIERSDSLAVEPNIVQKLVSDEDHDPTEYGEDIEVTHNDEEWNESEEYRYYQVNGSIEFLVDEDDPADINYTYEVPRDQAADDQLQALTVSTATILQLGVGLSFVVLFLFIGAFVAKRMRAGNSRRRGR